MGNAAWEEHERSPHVPCGYWEGADLESLPDRDREIIAAAEPYTMTGLVRLHALIIAVRHIIRAGIPGAFVECGVWRGGSALAIAATLTQLGVTDRDLWLYDTFAGMTEPSEHDVSLTEGRALAAWQAAQDSGEPLWSELFSPVLVNEGAVREVVVSGGYPRDRVHCVVGRVEDTLPGSAPKCVALLRLDTDWYSSTKHAMEHLYPRLASGGVLILDDYGHWKGAKKAVDEYFSGVAGPLLLSRVDYACRLGVKR
jgi:O-methyltransferase